MNLYPIIDNQGYIDYDELEMLAKNFKPKLIMWSKCIFKRTRLCQVPQNC